MMKPMEWGNATGINVTQAMYNFDDYHYWGLSMYAKALRNRTKSTNVPSDMYNYQCKKADDCDDQKAERACCGWISLQNMDGGKTNVASRCLKNRKWDDDGIKLAGYKYDVKGCPRMMMMM